ncbi:MAG: proline dehydrogenase family protein [Candidatus Liptonbacteria bacterium]|nr:proline dehydrogenase family protein [Candidatus Liptonbacteria bacterium]
MREFIDPMRWFTEDGRAEQELSRLISILPDIQSPREVGRVFREIIGPVRGELPIPLSALFLIGKLSDKLLSETLAVGSRIFSKKFIAGNGEKDILRACDTAKKRGFSVNIDILGESVCSEKEAERYLNSYLELISIIGERLQGEELSFSVKLSAFYSQVSSASPEKTATIIAERVAPIAELLQKNGGHVYLDAEEYEFLETYCLVFKKLYRRYGNTARFVLQSYLRKSPDVLSDLIKINDIRTPLHLRLVRGASWDHECYRAEKLGWHEPPVFTEKSDTDKNFEGLLRMALRNGLVAIPGTHNAKSIYFAVSEERFGLRIKELQVLKGMGEPFAEIIRDKGYKVRFYMPVLFPKGDISAAMAYLVRRIVENKSQTSFLALHRGEKLKDALRWLEKIPAKQNLSAAAKRSAKGVAQ